MSENVPCPFASESQLEKHHSTHIASTSSVESGLKCLACQHVSRPGELVCSSCGRLLVTPTKLGATNLLKANPAETFPCSRCGLACGAGVLACPRCGWSFDEDDITLDVDSTPLFLRNEHGPLGAVSVDDDQAILVEIEGKRLSLPIAPRVVLG